MAPSKDSSRRKSKTKAKRDAEPKSGSINSWLLGLNATIMVVLLAVLCVRPFHDPGVVHCFPNLPNLGDLLGPLPRGWVTWGGIVATAACAMAHAWRSRDHTGHTHGLQRGFTPPGSSTNKMNRTVRNRLPYSVRSYRRLQAKCPRGGGRPAIDGCPPREVRRSSAPHDTTTKRYGVFDFGKPSKLGPLDLPPSKNIRRRLRRMLRDRSHPDAHSCFFASALLRGLRESIIDRGVSPPGVQCGAWLLLAWYTLIWATLINWSTKLTVVKACFRLNNYRWSRNRWARLGRRGLASAEPCRSSAPARRCASIRVAVRRWTGRCAPWRCSTPFAALVAAAALNSYSEKLESYNGTQLSLVVDSGCVWHVVKDASLLINIRPCEDSMYGADGVVQECTCMGDLPVLAVDRAGRLRKTTIMNVRCVPTFVCPLLSVRQLWRDSKVDTLFADAECIVVNPHAKDGSRTELPFELATDDLYRWKVQVPGEALSKITRASSIGSAMVGGIHAASSTSHLDIMSAADVGNAIHHRLHLSTNILRRLPSCTADAPAALKHCPVISCDACTEANASHLPHSHSSGHSSAKAARSKRPGELVYADIAGPFVDSAHGGYKYALVLVDDFTRYKWVYFLRNKSEAAEYTNTFIASFNALLTKRFGADGAEPHVVSAIHTDNAGEFTSSEFMDLLDRELMGQSNSPAYTHHANGVAERAIRSIFGLVRSNMVAGGLKPGLWTYAVRHALDILNRCTGPSSGDSASSTTAPFSTSFELLTGDKPKVMGIMPLCCRAFAVKPRESYSKARIDSRAWVGYNLGRSATTVGAYDIFVQSLQRIVTTSEVYFDETLMPLRPAGDQRVGAVAPTPPPPTDHNATPGGLPQVNEKTAVAARKERMMSLREAVNKATSRGDGHLSKKVLILFSGPYNRPDGLGAYLAGMGLEAVMIDNDAERGGDVRHDIMHDSFFQSLLRRVALGEFLLVIAAPPCSTFSVSRFFPSRSAKDGGPPPVRVRDHITGRPDCPLAHRTELHGANELVRRMSMLLHVAHGAGSEFIIENPADRGDSSEPGLFIDERHGPIWLMPDLVTLRKACSCSLVTFSQCNFGAPSQKYTSFLFTPSLLPFLSHLDRLRCTHTKDEHEARAGGEKNDNGEWNSREHAAFPPALNFFLAETAAALVRQHGSPLQRREPGLPSPAPARDESLPARYVHDGGAPSRSGPPPLLLDGPSGEGAAADPLQLEGPRAQPDAATPARPASALTEESPSTDASPARRTPRATDGSASGTAAAEPGGGAVEGPTSAPSVFSPGGTNMEAYDDFQPEATQESVGVVPKTKYNPAGRGPQRTRQRVASEGGALISTSLSAMLSDDADLPPYMAPALLVMRTRWSACSYGGALVATMGDPTNHREAMEMDAEAWRPSEIKELKAHRRNGSFSEIDRSELPKGRRLVRMTWAYKTKRDGTKKSRLCVQGCSQIPGVDYDQTHSATLRPTSLRILSALAAKLNLNMRRWDFTSAFLQGSLLEGETVYCSPAPGYEDFDEDGNSRLGADGLPRIYRIEKPVYGMAQAGRRWQRGLFEWLKKNGFNQLNGDGCVFMKSQKNKATGKMERILVGVYVDDLCVLYGDDGVGSLYQEFAKELTASWEIEDEGNITDLLGVEISREGSCVVLRQTAYIRKLVKTYLSSEYQVKPTYPVNQGPCDDSLTMHVCDALVSEDPVDPVLLKKYQSLVGALLYCSTQTRPDIAFAVGYLCRAMAKPTEACYQDALRVLMYLDKHETVGLRYCACSTPAYGMSDSDWAVKHSTSGWTFQYQQATIAWASKKQNVVALSSCEAEIMAASEAAKEAVHLRSTLQELGAADDSPMSLSVDNQSAIAVAYNPEHHSRMKHVERRHLFIRECVENLQLVVPFVSTHENLADFFTKPLAHKKFFALRDRIMNHSSS